MGANKIKHTLQRYFQSDKPNEQRLRCGAPLARFFSHAPPSLTLACTCTGYKCTCVVQTLYSSMRDLVGTGRVLPLFCFMAGHPVTMILGNNGRSGRSRTGGRIDDIGKRKASAHRRGMTWTRPKTHSH